MSDADFPNGEWTGFYMQPLSAERHVMNIELAFDEGRLHGTGSDPVGGFTLDGEYDRFSGECRWIKQYEGKHKVTYAGKNEGEGIWGVWEISQMMGLVRGRGVFHIWPEGMTPTREANRTEFAMLGGGMLPPKPIAVVVWLAILAIGATLFFAFNKWFDAN